MEARLINYEELLGLRNLNNDAERLEERARILIRGLEEKFGSGSSVGGIPNMLIKQSNDPHILGTITSKFGIGRFVISFYIDDQEVKASLIVERMKINPFSQEVWGQVMSIPLPSPKWVIGTDSVSENERSFVLGASILHSIINGPNAREALEEI